MHPAVNSRARLFARQAGALNRRFALPTLLLRNEGDRLGRRGCRPPRRGCSRSNAITASYWQSAGANNGGVIGTSARLGKGGVWPIGSATLMVVLNTSTVADGGADFCLGSAGVASVVAITQSSVVARAWRTSATSRLQSRLLSVADLPAG